MNADPLRDSSGDGVVLLHAIARQARSMAALARALEAAGSAILVPAYPSRSASIAELARGLSAEIEAFSAPLARVHFVGHSMGGLVARAFIAEFRPPNLGRVVTMGTPHGGSEIADLLSNKRLYRAFYGPAGGELSVAAAPELNRSFGPIDYPLGSIAGNRALNIAAHFVLPRPNDGTVSVASTQVAGMADHRVVACAHFLLPGNAEVMALCETFLREGRF